MKPGKSPENPNGYRVPALAASFFPAVRRRLVDLGIIAAALTVIGVIGWHRESESAPHTVAAAAADSMEFRGFDLSNATIPRTEILSGGPPKDGIPAITKPRFMSVAEAGFMRDEDKVVGFVRGGVARAYPLRILVWHEIVNDSVAGQPIAVTYCPLCGTCMVFDRRHMGKELTFGVSGLLYQSDVLMYDHQTNSLWSQLMMQAVAGDYAGQSLQWLPSEEMTWKAWRERYPESEVLSTDTGFRRAYQGSPYDGYERSGRIMFPVPRTRDELANKDWIVGIIINGMPMAYPLKRLEQLGGEPLSDTVGGEAITVTYDAAAKWPTVRRAGTGEQIPHVSAYWFAWQAFYPATELYEEG